MNDLMYCENAECRVELYHGSGELEIEGQTVVGSPRNENCPGCGQFGRKKGKQ